MPFRKAEPSDVLPLAELWTMAFPGRKTVADRLLQLETGIPYGGLEVAWVEEEARELLGAFRAYRFTEVIARAELPMMGLGSVAVAPTARRRGIARRLCMEAIRLARERGDVISVLYPFKPSFYQALGWGAAGELRVHIFRPEHLPDYSGGSRVRRAATTDERAVADCYARVARASNGLVLRERGAWTHLLQEPGNHLFVLPDDGGVGGYAVVRFRSGRRPEAGTLLLRELVAGDEEARRALLSWVRAQRDQWSRVRYDAPPDSAFDRRLLDPRPPGFAHPRPLWHPVARVLQGPMLRILDVEAALGAPRGWGGHEPADGTLVVDLVDDLIPENAGPWSLEIGGGKGAVRPGSGKATARLFTDAATLASIYAGELAPSVAARLGLARVEGEGHFADRVFRTEERFRLLDTF